MSEQPACHHHHHGPCLPPDDAAVSAHARARDTASTRPSLRRGDSARHAVPLCHARVMLRIKSPAVSVPFYEKNFGMKLVHWISFPQWKFSVYFLERQREGQTSPECTLEKATVDSERYLNNMSGVALELTHNHGTEDDPDFKVWNGNTGRDAGEPGTPNYADEPKARGFGHIAFNCDDVYAMTDKLVANGVNFQKKPDEGRMKGLAFALDPDGYWIELVRRALLSLGPCDTPRHAPPAPRHGSTPHVRRFGHIW